jgi:hypothetical protein
MKSQNSTQDVDGRGAGVGNTGCRLFISLVLLFWTTLALDMAPRRATSAVGRENRLKLPGESLKPVYGGGSISTTRASRPRQHMTRGDLLPKVPSR